MNERIPDISRLAPRRAQVAWKDEQGRVTVTKPRKGALRRGVLRMFGIPGDVKFHLDPIGSQVWRLLDGKRTVAEIRDALHTGFPEESDLPRRLGQFFSLMVSRGLVEL